MRKILFGLLFVLSVSVAKAETLSSTIVNEPSENIQNNQDEVWNTIEKELNDPNIEWPKAADIESSEVDTLQNKEKSTDKKEKGYFWPFITGYSFGKIFK